MYYKSCEIWKNNKYYLSPFDLIHSLKEIMKKMCKKYLYFNQIYRYISWTLRRSYNPLTLSFTYLINIYLPLRKHFSYTYSDSSVKYISIKYDKK